MLSDEERKTNRTEYIKSYIKRPKVKDKRKKYMKGYYQRPEVKERIKEYNQKPKNKAKIKERMKEYNQKPEIKKRIKEYNQKQILQKAKRKEEYESRPEVKVRRKEYREQSKAKLKKYMKEYSKEYNQKPEIKKRIKRYRKEKYDNNSKFRISLLLRKRLYSALKVYTTTGKIQTSKQYGIDYKTIIEHLKPFPKDQNLYHIDHIRPLVSFNLEDPEEIKLAFAPKNHQWLLTQDNLSKGSKIEMQSIL